MKALTLTAPWSGLVAAGVKTVENRARPIISQRDFGSRFAIHASRELKQELYPRFRELAPDLDFTAPWYKLSRITSAVIGVATVQGVFNVAGLSRETIGELCVQYGIPDQARWVFGPLVYVLRDVVALPRPESCRGWQGFWTLTPGVECAIMEQLS